MRNFNGRIKESMSSGPLHRGMMHLQFADGGETGYT